MKKTNFLLLLFFPLNALVLHAQNDDLLSLLGDELTTDYVIATFKTTRIVNGHSIENVGEGVLDFKISHRFGPVRNGLYDVFGLDDATIRIGLDYGINDRLMVGVGRGGREKVIDGFAKYKLLRQSTGKRNMPITLSLLTNMEVKTVRFADQERDNKFTDRLFFANQLLIGRKFGEHFSLQIMPTHVHRNLTTTRDDKNDVFAVGAAGRIKLSRRVTVNAEYYYVPEGQVATPYANCLALGFEIETGGHVFQLHFTNTSFMNYSGFITQTAEDWFFNNGGGKLMSGARFGFNISRVFTLKKPKGFE
ncbi:MAG: hypothetical protein KF734_07040 [Saprospiraceae bacterium]|nr:hypothetical protein [Saprospiraceae bacterium]